MEICPLTIKSETLLVQMLMLNLNKINLKIIGNEVQTDILWTEGQRTHGQPFRWGQFQATNEAFTTLVICCKFQKNCFEL